MSRKPLSSNPGPPAKIQNTQNYSFFVFSGLKISGKFLLYSVIRKMDASNMGETIS